MLKRKRDDTDDGKSSVDRIQDRAIRIKASRLRARIDLGNKKLKSAVQLARGFERQKLGRRQKQASQEPHVLLRLREEVILLKELDAGKTARDYLFKQLVRTKKIKESPAFVALYGDGAKVEGVKSTAEGNVLGRLFNANPVKEVLPDILKGIRDVLGVDKPGTKAKDGTKTDTNGNSNGNLDRSENSKQQDLQTIAAGESEDFSGFSDAEEPQARPPISFKKTRDMSDLKLDSDDEDEVDLEHYNRRLASFSASDESDIEMMIDSDNPVSTGRQVAPSPGSSTKNNTDSDYDSELDPIDESSPPPRLKPKTPASKSQPPPQPLSKTSFLPSLSMGGYYSGSESDPDDFNPDRGPAVLTQPRKNRRGQRARQQIAEKKYGQNAKHLSRQQQQQQQKTKSSHHDRNQGWDARKGAVGLSATTNGDRMSSRGRFGRNNGGAGGSGDGRTMTGANGDAVRPRNNRKEKEAAMAAGPLHPSWEAAKKRKEEAGTVAFAGKKITFD